MLNRRKAADNMNFFKKHWFNIIRLTVILFCVGMVVYLYTKTSCNCIQQESQAQLNLLKTIENCMMVCVTIHTDEQNHVVKINDCATLCIPSASDMERFLKDFSKLPGLGVER